MSVQRFSWTAVACLVFAVGGCGGSDSGGSGTGGAAVATGGTGLATGGTGVATGGTGVATGGTGVATGGTNVVGTGGMGATGGTGAGMAGVGGMGAAGTTSTAPDLQMCLDRGMMMGENPTCTMCTCTKCFDDANNVFNNADEDFKAKAKALIDCVRMTCCKGVECYCGPVANPALPLECLGAGAAKGPCKAEINAAAGLTMDDPIMVQTLCGEMGTTACAAAQKLGKCVQGDSTAMPPLMGMCSADMCTTCPP